MRTNLDLIGPSEAFELPEPHVLRLHPPLPAGRTLVRALPCQHHDAPTGSKRDDGYFTFPVSYFNTKLTFLGRTERLNHLRPSQWALSSGVGHSTKTDGENIKCKENKKQNSGL